VHYPNPEDVYGEDVETLLQEADTQPLSQPIIAPVQNKVFSVEEVSLPEVTYSRSYQANLMGLPEQIRNIALVGHLLHGKTSFLDMLVTETHDVRELQGRRENEQVRYTDTHTLERDRGISIHGSPISLLLQNRKGKSHLFNIIDTPGHVDFIDEVVVAGRLADGFVVVVDVIEGLMVNAKRILRFAANEGIPFVVVLNKIDRLILELKLPPEDAYYKIRHCITEINDFLALEFPTRHVKVGPELENIIFASASMEWCFTVKSFAAMYSLRYPSLDPDQLARRLWGDIYYDPERRQFSGKTGNGLERCFVYFILKPLYKLYVQTIGEDAESLKATLDSLKIFLKPSAFKLNARPLLKLVCKEFFGSSSAFVDSVLEHIPSPVEASPSKIERIYTGPQVSEIAESMGRCDQDGQLAIQVCKLYTSADASELYALGRVFSGTVRVGQDVRVLGEGYSLDDEEDMTETKVSQLWIPHTRYKVPVDAVPAGNWVLMAGIGASIVKSATVFSTSFKQDAYIFKPMKYISQPVFKVAVEPINPSELPKLLDGLRKVNKTYPLLQTKVEESGEHIILGSGEMYMDCVLHDLRKLFAEMDIKVSDPVVKFSETCIETSAIKCYAETPNKRNKITIIAEPLENEIANDIESGKVDIRWPIKKIAQHFKDNYDWDALSARSIWAFGPDEMGPNVLQDDTLPSEVDKRLLNSVSASIRQGFQWSVREGPLCEEPIRGTKFRIIDTILADQPIHRGGGQIIPTSRRACYSAFLLASPRLLEPVYACHIVCPGQSVSAIYELLTRRRGNVISDTPIAGTPLYSVEGIVPVIDSFGFETDLRIASTGRAAVSMVFDKWQIVPGDPLDRNQKTKPLTAANPSGLARDFVLKTRRSKGLSEEPTINKYLDESLISSLAESGLLD
jgi:U5 small nuclear ribonucleoprotein component